jgi:hypothetical protein
MQSGSAHRIATSSLSPGVYFLNFSEQGVRSSFVIAR